MAEKSRITSTIRKTLFRSQSRYDSSFFRSRAPEMNINVTTFIRQELKIKSETIRFAHNFPTYAPIIEEIVWFTRTMKHAMIRRY